MFGVTLIPTLLLAASVSSETPVVDPNVVIRVFGGPSTATPSAVTKSTAKPIEGIVTSVNSAGEPCQCMPQWKCYTNLTSFDDPELDGHGLLNIRFNKPRVCDEVIELCCSAPKPITEITKKPIPKECGYSNPNGLGFKVTGGTGTEAEYGEFPWVVAILDGASSDVYIGVGAIIHPQVVITGANIAGRAKPGKMKIRAGEWDTQGVQEQYGQQEVVVEEIYSHSGYNRAKQFINDVALLRLAALLTFGPHIYALCLPVQGEDFSDSKGCVSNGWGKDQFGKNGVYYVLMKKVKQDIVPYDKCNAQLKATRLGPTFNLPRPSLLCAGGVAGVDTCTGDGGASLACPIGNNRYKLAGLVAWGIGCAEKDVPAVFAKVSEFRSWVDSKMDEWGYGSQVYTIK